MRDDEHSVLIQPDGNGGCALLLWTDKPGVAKLQREDIPKVIAEIGRLRKLAEDGAP